MPKYIVAALYKFTKLEDCDDLQKTLARLTKEWDLCGTLLLAKEGINGTVAGTPESIEKLKVFLKSDERFAGLCYKESFSENRPFFRMKVRIKKEIVSLGSQGCDPNRIVGTYVEPKDWNDIISDPETLVIDTRNDYEVKAGTFKNAINPKTNSFSEFPQFVKENFDPKKHKKIAMCCTGGIRCEKASSFMLDEGFDTVYHLKGGILKYLEEVEKDKSMWEGECFVFDNRVAVEHGLKIGSYQACYGCRLPLSKDERESKDYIEGVQCHYCAHTRSSKQKASSTERQRQIEFAKKRGEEHIGSPS